MPLETRQSAHAVQLDSSKSTRSQQPSCFLDRRVNPQLCEGPRLCVDYTLTGCDWLPPKADCRHLRRASIMRLRGQRVCGTAASIALVLAVACVRLAAGQLITNSATLIVEQTGSLTTINGTDVMLTNNPSERLCR